MSFAIDLWDRFDLLCRMTDEALDGTKAISTFMQKRADLEAEYARGLLKLCNAKNNPKFFDKIMSKSNDASLVYRSLQAAWSTMTYETSRLANMHSELASLFANDLAQPLNGLIKEKEVKRKYIVDNGQRAIRELQEVYNHVAKTKATFEKSKSDAEKNQDLYDRSLQDSSIKQSQLSKLSSKASHGKAKAHVNLEVFQQATLSAQQAERKYYAEDMPKVLEDIQTLEEQRYDDLASYLKQFADIQSQVPSQISDLVKNMKEGVAAISRDDDFVTFIRENISGQSPPALEGVQPPNSNPRRLSSANTAAVNAPGVPASDRRTSRVPSLSDMEPRRMAKALYDYTAPDSTHISFNAGDDVYVFVEDTSGWWLGECGGMVGWFPSNYVDGADTPAMPSSPAPRQQQMTASVVEEKNKQVVTALYAYEPPPHEDSHLRILTDDQVTVLKKDNSGWWLGSCRGKIGWFPNNYVTSKPVKSKKDNELASLFGGSLKGIMTAQIEQGGADDVPEVLDILTGAIEKLGGFETDGIFRIAADVSDVQVLKAQFKRGDLSISTEDPHVVANLLKLWLRELLDPLVPEEYYDACMNCKSAQDALDVVDALPTYTRNTILYLCRFLKTLVEYENLTRMSSANVATVFSPSFFRPSTANMERAMINNSKEREFVKSLIEYVPLE